MRHTLSLFSLLFALVTLLGLPPDAEAKRLGGGQSMGRQYSQPSAPPASSPSRQQAAPATAPGAPRTGGASRWLGPLAGLAAGGLIAALLFGEGFEGFRFMDFLMIALLVFGAVMVFRALRSRAQPQPHPAGGASPAPREYEPLARESHGPAVGGGGFGGAAQAPEWFDGPSFAEGAKAHFLRLQEAWDRGDFQEIGEYTTLDLRAQLEAEHQKLGGGPNVTEVLELDSELAGVQRDGSRVVVSVRFSGLIRESAGAAPERFAEIWHVQHAWSTPDGNWTIAGIQQV